MESIDDVRRAASRRTSEARANTWHDPIKRMIDVALSSMLLIAAMPVLIPAAALIALDSPGAILYRRLVVGRNGKPFHAFKLRTMVPDSDTLLQEDEGVAEEFNSNHKLKHDPRVTRVGGILRKTSIDELPQLVNVLRGEMSLVGPRMISFPELEKFGEWQEKILAVKPGITGLWQVSGRSQLDYDERVRLNVYYVDHRSILMDLRILARTIPAVITGRGAY